MLLQEVHSGEPFGLIQRLIALLTATSNGVKRGVLRLN